MIITVETGSWAARYVAERLATVDLPANGTAADAISAVGLPADEAGMVTLGDQAIPKDRPLSEGDVVKIYPVIIGG